MTTFIGRFSQFRTMRIVHVVQKIRDQFSRNRFPHSLSVPPPTTANGSASDAPQMPSHPSQVRP